MRIIIWAGLVASVLFSILTSVLLIIGVLTGEVNMGMIINVIVFIVNSIVFILLLRWDNTMNGTRSRLHGGSEW